LEVGELSQSVVVEAHPEQLNTTSGEVAHVIDQRQVNNLPLNGRSYMELLTLVPGAAFNLATKNGTNQFHGAAFEYFRNDVLDARDVFSPAKTELRYNDFGYNLGGPIIRNKLFFFIGEDGRDCGSKPLRRARRFRHWPNYREISPAPARH
jgi:hypothetical protein